MERQPMTPGLREAASRKLGRRPVRPLPGVPALARYATAAPLPAPPARAEWVSAVSGWPMLANDRVGDCTLAAAGHLIQAWTTATGAARVMTDADAISAYTLIGGYRPGDPATDIGCYETAVLGWWLTKGLAVGEGPLDLLDGFATLDPRDGRLIRQAIALLGGVYAGLSLPLTAQDGGAWEVPASGPVGDGAPGSWGGHAVPLLGYDAEGLVCVTWGAPQRLSWAFWETYADEAYALLSRDFLAANGTTGSGLSWAAFAADMEGLRARLAFPLNP
ncbi:MAG: hypothetical protein ACP5NI_09045 [Acetobacteraceae bacterium]